MTLTQLNESIPSYEEGLVVFLDKRNKTFRFVDPKDSMKRGLTSTISSKKDYDKLLKSYKLDSEFDEFRKISNEVKKSNKNSDMRKALAAMQKDILKMSKSK